MKKVAIVRAEDQERFSDATIYSVTYLGCADLDKHVQWGYVERLIADGYEIRRRDRTESD